MAVIAQSEAGAIESIDNLKRRQLSVYYRPHTGGDGKTEWIPTMPLPSDPMSKNKYFAKGFRLAPPTQDASGNTLAVDAEKNALLEENANLKAELERRKRDGRPPKAA